MRKSVLCVLLALLICASAAASAEPLSVTLTAPLEGGAGPMADCPGVPAPSVILIERETGRVLCEKNADEKLAPASVTKIMTLLLTAEAVEAGLLTLDTKVTVSRAAMNTKGSTACLGEGERYTVHEMLKAVAVQSANDGSVVLAEAVAGTQDSFVARMNARAAELGMTGTHFANAHGLDDPDHYTTARDVAVMSRELLSHDLIRQYTTIWMDSLRDGTFMLASTNRMVRYYEGTTGLKTGTTPAAGCCISASALRGGMELVAVVMKAKTSDERYEAARSLLDFGFATFTTVAVWPDEVPKPIPVLLGRKDEVQPVLSSQDKVVIEKRKAGLVERRITMASDVQAPVSKGQKLGELTLLCEGKPLAQASLVAAEDIGRLSWWDVFARMLGLVFMSGR